MDFWNPGGFDEWLMSENKNLNILMIKPQQQIHLPKGRNQKK